MQVDGGIDATIQDRHLIRACYRYYSNEFGREIARWETAQFAYQIQMIRLGNLDWKEARRG